MFTSILQGKLIIKNQRIIKKISSISGQNQRSNKEAPANRGSILHTLNQTKTNYNFLISTCRASDGSDGNHNHPERNILKLPIQMLL
jgi:hypothetical protein